MPGLPSTLLQMAATRCSSDSADSPPLEAGYSVLANPLRRSNTAKESKTEMEEESKIKHHNLREKGSRCVQKKAGLKQKRDGMLQRKRGSKSITNTTIVQRKFFGQQPT